MEPLGVGGAPDPRVLSGALPQKEKAVAVLLVEGPDLRAVAASEEAPRLVPSLQWPGGHYVSCLSPSRPEAGSSADAPANHRGGRERDPPRRKTVHCLLTGRMSVCGPTSRLTLASRPITIHSPVVAS